MFRAFIVIYSIALLSLLPNRSDAADISNIASAFEPGKPFEARVTVRYQRHSETGAIRRERTGAADQTEVTLGKELRFSHTRHVLAPRLEVGIWKDLELHIEIPVIVSDSRSFRFDQSGDCSDPQEENCVTPVSSTLVRDQFVDGSQMDAKQTAVGSSSRPSGGLLLPTRRGLDQFNVGLTWAPWNQRRSPHLPTWLLGFESRLAVGTAMEYDPTNPQANRGSSEGVHQFSFWTAMTKRFRFLEPWFRLEYILPVAAAGSLYKKTTFANSGQRSNHPQHRATGEIGVEIVPWERPEDHLRIGIEISTAMDAVFAGRGYSPIWELFANNSVLRGPCHPSVASADPEESPPWSNGTYCGELDDPLPYPGITRIDDYLVIRGKFAINAQLTRYARLQIGIAIGHQQSHFITSELPGSPGDESRYIDREDPQQLNPMYRNIIDTPGRRFKLEDSTVFDLFATATAMF